jgi:hypothetical protein
MSARQMTSEDRANYQRILAAYPTISLTLLGFHVTVTIAGLAGIFALMAGTLYTVNKLYWVSLLVVLLLFVTLMLFLMWLREHWLKDQAVDELKASGLRFPEQLRPWYAGLVTAMHTIFYLGAIGGWAILLLIAEWNPQLLLGKFGASA